MVIGQHVVEPELERKPFKSIFFHKDLTTSSAVYKTGVWFKANLTYILEHYHLPLLRPALNKPGKVGNVSFFCLMLQILLSACPDLTTEAL